MKVLFKGALATTGIIAATAFGGEAVAAANSSGHAAPTDNSAVTQLHKHSDLAKASRPKVGVSQAVKRTFIADHEHDKQ